MSSDKQAFHRSRVQFNRNNIKVPHGHLVLSNRWRGSSLSAQLGSSVSILFSGEFPSCVDFQFSEFSGGLFISEADMVAETYSSNLTQLRQAFDSRSVVIVEKSKSAGTSFQTLQRLCVLEMGMTLIPISSRNHLPQLLAQLVHAESKSDQNPLCKKPTVEDCGRERMVKTLTLVPGLGDSKAQALIKRFNSLHGLANASVNEIASVVGMAVAQKVYSHFRD